MDYELLKKLKDAGYPGSNTWFDNKGKYYSQGADFVSPTLSELIEECVRTGIGDFKIHVYPYGTVIERKGYDDMEFKSTSLEAMAYFYLLINKKNEDNNQKP